MTYFPFREHSRIEHLCWSHTPSNLKNFLPENLIPLTLPILFLWFHPCKGFDWMGLFIVGYTLHIRISSELSLSNCKVRTCSLVQFSTKESKLMRNSELEAVLNVVQKPLSKPPVAAESFSPRIVIARNTRRLCLPELTASLGCKSSTRTIFTSLVSRSTLFLPELAPKFSRTSSGRRLVDFSFLWWGLRTLLLDWISRLRLQSADEHFQVRLRQRPAFAAKLISASGRNFCILGLLFVSKKTEVVLGSHSSYNIGLPRSIFERTRSCRRFRDSPIEHWRTGSTD